MTEVIFFLVVGWARGTARFLACWTLSSPFSRLRLARRPAYSISIFDFSYIFINEKEDNGKTDAQLSAEMCF
jgi:hypothetical protein